MENQENNRRVCPKCSRQYSGKEMLTNCPIDGARLLPAAQSALCKELFGRYEIVSLIGSGGWSTVYRARQITLGQPVAIKVLHQHLASDSQMLKRFEQEAQTASTLSHPNIVGIIDYGASPQPFIVMEYVEGGSLADELEQQQVLSAQMSIEIALAICSALAAAHDRGIIHRDIKPSNIILTNSAGEHHGVKVVDFGLSKLVESDEDGAAGITRTGEALGSPPYMSPEQWSGKGVDARSDIYALGCLLYEALTGRPAFPGKSPVECMNKHLTELPEGIVAVRPELTGGEDLDRIVFKALSKDSSLRYQSIQELACDLEQAKAGEKPTYAGRRKHPLGEWLKWRRAILLRAALITSCLLLCLALAAFFYREEIFSNIWNFNYKAGVQAFERKDYKTADSRFTTALSILDLAGSKDKRLYWTLMKQSQVLRLQQQSIRLSETNRRIFELTHGNKRCQSLLAAEGAAYAKDDWNTAHRLCLEFIAEARKISPSNLALSTGLNDLGATLVALRKYPEAEQSLRESLKIQQEWLATNSPDFAATQQNLAQALTAQNKFTEARELLESALSINRQIFGPQSSNVANTLNDLGQICFWTKDYRSAVKYYKLCLPIWEKTADFENAPLAIVLNNMGTAYMYSGQYELAESQLQRSMELVKKWYGPNDPHVAELSENLAQVRYNQHDRAGALQFLKKSLDIRSSKLGANSPVTLKTKEAYEKLLNSVPQQ